MIDRETKPGNYNWQLSDLLSNIDIGIFSRDILADKYLSLSDGCCKIYGYTSEEFINNPKLWQEVIYPDDKHLADAEFELLQKGQKSKSEYRIIHKSGAIRWIEIKVIPIFSNQKLVRVDGIVADITERKQAELQITEAKGFSEIIINSLPGIFYMYDIHGKFNFWNKNFETVTGYTSEEIKSLHPLDLFEGEEKELLLQRIELVFEQGSAEVEANLVTKDGTKIPFYFNGRKVNYGGEVKLVGMGIDITQRKIAEETLQKSEEMLSHILNSIPQSIFWKDTQSTFIGCNSVFAKTANLEDTASVVGKTDFDFPWMPEEAIKYREDDFMVMSSKKPKIHFVETLKQPNGETLWVDTTKIPLKNENDEVYGILGIFDDITKRKQAEEKQERMNFDLIQKNIELRRFAYIVSHNLRAPISKILGLAALFEKENESDPLNAEMIGYIEKEVLDLDKVVKDLNTIVSAQDLGGKVLEEVNIHDEFVRIKNSLESELLESSATIKANFTKAETIKSVRSYLYSILYNLISNAIKYRDTSKPLSIEIETYALSQSQFICLCVKDNGLGIDVERYGEKLFGLYNRFHKGIIPGKGIGLIMVKTQVEALGGKIEISSSPGKGTTFKVYFPND